MGRDKPKKRMNMMQKSAYLKSQASKYGISASDYQDDEGNHKNRLGAFTGQSMEESVIKAMNNDYDLRESLKYGIDSGNKHFDGLDNRITDINSAVGAHRAVVNYGDKVLDHKKTSSANDFANISSALFNDSRSKFGESFATPEKQQEEAAAPVELSTELQDAKEKVKAFENKKYDIFKGNDTGNTQTAASDGDDQRKQAAGSFLDKYKLDVKANISPKLPV